MIIPDEVLEIQYDCYKSTSTTFTVDHAGNVDEHIGLEARMIKISHNWRKNVGDKPKGGYLAKGLMKYVFMVGFNMLCINLQ